LKERLKEQIKIAKKERNQELVADLEAQLEQLKIRRHPDLYALAEITKIAIL
jgi:hypothetical protein